MSCIKNISRGCCFGRNENGEAEATSCAGCHKMEAWDWLQDLPDPLANNELFEVQFKNTRKGYYLNSNNLEIKRGDVVAVEASPGHDMGVVTLTGDMVTRQMKKTGFTPRGIEFKKIFRLAKPYDIEKWQEAIALEHSTMIRSRQIAADLNLNMKIGDVEYQGDRLKAIFYYIAEERVDFRELIKIFAEQFRIRVEMKQIGARQEAGRIGGIAACGREVCCSTWINNFSSVTIGAARHQEISLNPQKLAGQCGKLKCCLNYELDTYIEAAREFPRVHNPLETMDGSYFYIKSDTLNRTMWFTPDPQVSTIQIPLGIDRVRQIMEMNRKGIKADKLDDSRPDNFMNSEPEFKNVVGEDSITRFDRSGKDQNRRNRGRGRGRGGNKENVQGGQGGQNREQKGPDGGQRQEKQTGGRNGGNRGDNRPKEQRADNRQPQEGGRPQQERGQNRSRGRGRDGRDRGPRPQGGQTGQGGQGGGQQG